MKASRIAAAAMLAAIVPASAHAQTPFEARVLQALNAVRSDPAGFVATLKAFRGSFEGAGYTRPGTRIRIVTNEGVAAVDDAITSLSGRQGMGAVASAQVLAAAAADHVAEQAASGATGHQGTDGASPAERVRRRGGSPYVAEVIEYGAGDPIDVVRQLIVDDGVADRGHRAALLDPAMRAAGVACGPHPAYRSMCVIVMERRAGITVAEAAD